MLGMWMAPSGNNTKIIQSLKSEALSWGGKVRNSHSTLEEVWTALHCNISAKLRYPLEDCTLTEYKCKSIMFPEIRAALPRAHITANLNTAFRDGPVDSLGGGVLSLYHFTCTSRTTRILEQLNRGTLLGKIINTNIEDLVRDAGLHGPVWDMDVSLIYKYVDKHSWLYASVEYNAAHDIQISVKHECLKKYRENDKSIMARAGELYDKVTELKAINRVRTLHQVINISDISSADGRRLNQIYLKKRACSAIRNTHIWPMKHHVISDNYTIWRKFLRKVFPTHNFRLETSLNKWTIPRDCWFTTWE